MNKAMSLVVVAAALPFRMWAVPFDQVAANWPTILVLLAGSLLGAWIGADEAWLKSGTLQGHRGAAGRNRPGAAFRYDLHGGTAPFTGPAQIVAGVIAGVLHRDRRVFLGVAGGGCSSPP